MAFWFRILLSDRLGKMAEMTLAERDISINPLDSTMCSPNPHSFQSASLQNPVDRFSSVAF
jgi:hypothetical protein